MGSEFIEKAAPAFKKSWDRARLELTTADLFTRTPDSAARTATAEILGDSSLQVGEKLTVEACGRTLVARKGLADVARFTNPAPALLDAVRASCGIAGGTVEQVYSKARVVDISLC